MKNAPHLETHQGPASADIGDILAGRAVRFVQTGCTRQGRRKRRSLCDRERLRPEPSPKQPGRLMQ